MKKSLSLILAALLLFCCLPTGSADAPAQFYDVPSDHYSPEAAQQALTMSELCYRLFYQELYMAGLGYTKVGDWNMTRSADDTRHTAGYAVFLKRLENGRDAAVIAIRGTGEGEWPLNMDIAPSGNYDLPYAENFYLAAKDILDAQEGFLSELNQPLLLVTGHSRGAAIANLLSAWLTDRYGSENVYGYTFASPRTVRGETPFYGNIFNVVNPADIVTCLPFPQWGFVRYGQDLILPVDEPTDGEWQAVLSAYDARIDKLGEDITLRLTSEDVQAWARGITDVMPTVEEAYALRHALTHPGLAADGEESVTGWDLMEDMIRLLLHGDEKEILRILDAVQPAGNDLTPAADAIRTLLSRQGIAAVSTAHMPATYGAWMTVLQP